MKLLHAGVALTMTLSNCLAESPKLSPEGIARREAHAFLFEEFVANRDADFKGEGAGRILNEVVISRERFEVEGDITIDLPEGSQRVASMFRYLLLRGEGLDNLGGITMLPYSPSSDASISTKQPELYRVKVVAMPIPSASMPTMRLSMKSKPGTKAVITEIAFNSQGKLSTVFDDIPYRNLGEEFPRERVVVKVDLENELSIDGHVDLEREKFCRYYAAPGTTHPNFERWAAERNFLPGRQILKLQPALVVGYSKNQPKLKERSDRPGAADLSFFEQYSGAESLKRTIDPFKDIPYAMCFNDYPEFMSVKACWSRHTARRSLQRRRGTCRSIRCESGERCAGRSATWWEVKNESTIKSEWDYHYQKEHDAWELLAEFHNDVADAVHQQSAETKVGGPSSAWMQVQVRDFGLYRNQAKFMDLTRDHVDFYSHHFYEDIGTLGAWERRGGKYTNYLLGRLEAILDMLVAHMHETDNVKPMLITECGSLQPGRGPSDYWLRMRSYSAYMHKFMQRPQQIDLAVPFAFMSIPWNPKSGDAAFIPKEGMPNHCPPSDCDRTPLADWFELWRDFDGRRLPVEFNQQWLDITALHSGDRVQLAMTNMGGRRLSVDLSAMSGELPIESVSQRRIYYQDGEVVFDVQELQNTSTIPIDVEETTIVTLNLTQPAKPVGTVLRQRNYANGTAIKAAAAREETIEIEIDDSQDVSAATLVIGVARTGGLGGPVKGTFNGKPFESKAAWAQEFNNLFAPVRIAMRPADLNSQNRVTIDVPDGTTITSVYLETDRRISSTVHSK